MKKRIGQLLIVLLALLLAAGCFFSPVSLASVVRGQSSWSAYWSGWKGLLTGEQSLSDVASSKTSFAEASFGDNLITITGQHNYDPLLDVSDEDLADHTEYYYNELTEEEQKLYKEIYVIVRYHKDLTQVSTTNMAELSRVFEFVTMDNPELYYVDALKTQTTTTGDYSTMAITADEALTQEEQEKADQAIENYYQDFLTTIPEDLTDYQKALYAYNYVVKHTTYVEDAPYNQNMYSAVLGESVCRGYAGAYKYLCDRMGIGCIMVIGQVNGEGHAWNMVYLDGAWCHVDCTSGDDLSSSDIEVDYAWFGLDDTLLGDSYVATYPDMVPEATGLQNDYYYRKSRYFTDFDVDNLTSLVASGTDFSFQCSSQELFQEYCDALGSNQEVSAAIGEGGQIQYMGNPDSYTIYVIFK